MKYQDQIAILNGSIYKLLSMKIANEESKGSRMTKEEIEVIDNQIDTTHEAIHLLWRSEE